MSETKTGTAQAHKPTDLVAQYRPLGLKAVLAAALQHKAKPAKKPAVAAVPLQDA